MARESVMSDVKSTLAPGGYSHPLRDTFKQLRVRQLDVAHYCGVTISSLAQYLNGYRAAPPHVESRMQALAAKVRREREQAQAREQGSEHE